MALVRAQVKALVFQEELWSGEEEPRFAAADFLFL